MKMTRKPPDKEVSVLYWMLAMFVTSLPVINLIVVPIMAFKSSTPTKRNYYRAIIAWCVLFFLINLVIVLTISWPKLIGIVQGWFQDGSAVTKPHVRVGR